MIYLLASLVQLGYTPMVVNMSAALLTYIPLRAKNVEHVEQNVDMQDFQ